MQNTMFTYLDFQVMSLLINISVMQMLRMELKYVPTHNSTSLVSEYDQTNPVSHMPEPNMGSVDQSFSHPGYAESLICLLLPAIHQRNPIFVHFQCIHTDQHAQRRLLYLP